VMDEAMIEGLFEQPEAFIDLCTNHLQPYHLIQPYQLGDAVIPMEAIPMEAIPMEAIPMEAMNDIPITVPEYVIRACAARTRRLISRAGRTATAIATRSKKSWNMGPNSTNDNITSTTVSLDPIGTYRDIIRQHITASKAFAKSLGKSFTVIDVGGGADKWSHDLIDAVVDFLPAPPDFPATIQRFVGDMTQSHVWDAVLAYTSIHGKFDYVICTHTIEDLVDPRRVVEGLPRIARGGHVAVPSR